MADADLTRTVDYGSGRYTVNDTPSGFAAGLMYELAYSIPGEDGASLLQPLLNINWRHARFSNFNESGSDAALDVRGIRQDTLIVSLGMRTQHLLGSQVYNRDSLLEGRALIKTYTGDRQSTAETRFMGAGRSGELKSVKVGSLGLELGAQLTIPTGVNSPSSLFADASLELRESYTNFNATIGWKTTF